MGLGCLCFLETWYGNGKRYLTAFNNKLIQTKIYVLPEHVIYFVHAGGAVTSDYAAWSDFFEPTLQNIGVPDQKYDAASSGTWGYMGNATNSSGDNSGNLFTSLRYLRANSGNDLTYRFDLNNGKYKVYTGLHDPWYQYSKGNRKADIMINGEIKTSGFVFTDAYDVLQYNDVQVTDGKLELTVHRSASAPATNSDPQISWIMIIDEQLPITTAALQPEEPSGSNGWYTSDVMLTLTSTDEGAGAASTEYRLNGGEWQRYTEPVMLSQEGILTVDYRSTDLAGNTEATKSLTVKLDKTDPELLITVDKPVIGPPNHRLVPIQVTINTADEASGISKIELTGITSNEPDNANGDGNSESDIQDAQWGTDEPFLYPPRRAFRRWRRPYIYHHI